MARQRSLDRDVAIKLLSPQISGNPEFRQSFQATARTMARLNHPNLIGVFDSGYIEGMLYFIMEFVPGKSLEHSSRGQQVDVMQSIRLIEAIADGLSHAHAHGIFHGELDPGDILLNQKAEPKIGNFGFSHPLESTDGNSPFAAPEIRAGAAPDAKSDIYAVGALLYQLVTGHPHREDAPEPSTLCNCGSAVDALWKQATHPDPAARHADMVSFRKAATELAKGRQPAPARATPPISQRMAVASRKTDQVRPAQAPRTLIRKKQGPNWKLALNVILNLVLLGSLPFAWKHFKETRARKEREFNEQIAREKAGHEKPAEAPVIPKTGGSHVPNAPDLPRPTPKPAPPTESPTESLSRLK
jgi:serine/threonine protein kinase